MFNMLVPIVRSVAQPVLAKATQTIGQKAAEYAVKAAVTTATVAAVEGVTRVVTDQYNDWRAKNGYGHYVHSR